jgi:hypothetical protein
MNIASVGASTAAAATQPQIKGPLPAQSAVAAPEHGRVGDTVEISPSRSNRSAMQRDNAVKTVNMQAQMLRRMAERIIKEQYSQGNHLFMLLYGNKAVQLDPSLRVEGMGFDFNVEITPQQQQAVANAIEYFSPAQTGRRIIDTAEDIAGGPGALTQKPVLTDAFRSAVNTAFLNVQNEVGGNLPDLTQRTYETTMQSFSALKALAVDQAV